MTEAVAPVGAVGDGGGGGGVDGGVDGGGDGVGGGVGTGEDGGGVDGGGGGRDGRGDGVMKSRRPVWIFGGSPGDACSTENPQHDAGEEIASEIYAYVSRVM